MTRSEGYHPAPLCSPHPTTTQSLPQTTAHDRASVNIPHNRTTPGSLDLGTRLHSYTARVPNICTNLQKLSEGSVVLHTVTQLEWTGKQLLSGSHVLCTPALQLHWHTEHTLLTVGIWQQLKGRTHMHAKCTFPHFLDTLQNYFSTSNYNGHSVSFQIFLVLIIWTVVRCSWKLRRHHNICRGMQTAGKLHCKLKYEAKTLYSVE